MRIILIVTSIFFIVSCTQRKKIAIPFSQEQQLKQYLQEMHEFEMINGYVFLLDNQHCGTCNHSTIEFIKNIKTNEKKYIVLSNAEEQLVSILSQIENSKLLIDKRKGRNMALYEYGLSFPYATMLIYKEKQIAMWSYVKVDDQIEIEKLKKEMKLLSYR